MALFYLDTSAIIKRYRHEQSTDVIDELFLRQAQAANIRFFSSFLIVIEVTSAILRLAKGRHLFEDAAAQVLVNFRADITERIHVWPLDETITHAAVHVVEQHRLKSGDAIHLATALAISRTIPGETVVVVASDTQLIAAAGASGLEALNPEHRSWRAQLSRLGLPS